MHFKVLHICQSKGEQSIQYEEDYRDIYLDLNALDLNLYSN